MFRNSGGCEINVGFVDGASVFVESVFEMSVSLYLGIVNDMGVIWSM